MKSHADGLMSRREVLGGFMAGVIGSGLLLTGVRADDKRLAAVDRASGEGHVLHPGLKMIRESRAALNETKDYTATFFKQELVGRKILNTQLAIKVREEPFSVYMRFISPEEGREVIYIEGRNDGKMLAHGVGIEKVAGTLKLDPAGKRALEESRYPITMVGMRRMLESLNTQWESELKLTGASVRYFPNSRIGNVECRVFESAYAQATASTKFQMTRLYVQKDSGLPVRVEQFAFPEKAGAQPVMVEQYTYLDVKKNVGLTDLDFDTNNEQYDF